MMGSPIDSGYKMKLHCEVKNEIDEIRFRIKLDSGSNPGTPDTTVVELLQYTCDIYPENVNP